MDIPKAPHPKDGEGLLRESEGLPAEVRGSRPYGRAQESAGSLLPRLLPASAIAAARWGRPVMPSLR
ncbi:hypothetical protein Srufu_006680 [Streptomyces libani subsp. rufus]|nr:hypothetical protein Srufu_006680 [Streptomyces libani subsp. rufus]